MLDSPDAFEIPYDTKPSVNDAMRSASTMSAEGEFANGCSATSNASVKLVYSWEGKLSARIAYRAQRIMATKMKLSQMAFARSNLAAYSLLNAC